MAAAAEKLACLLVFVSITILVDSQIIRPYTQHRDRGRGSGFHAWPRFASSSGLSFRRGSFHRPISRPLQQPRLRTTVLHQTLVVNDNTNFPSSRRNQRPSSRRRHTRRGGAAMNSPRHTSGLRSSQFSPRGRRLGSQTLLRRPAQTSRTPPHKSASRNALQQRIRQRTEPATRPRHRAGRQNVGRNNLIRTGSHSGPALHKSNLGHSGTDIGLLGSGASHNSPALHSGITGHGSALHIARLHNAQQPGGLGLLGIGANQLIPGAGLGTSELGILGAGMGSDGLAGVIAALMGTGLGAGGSGGAASGGTGSSHAAGGAAVGTGTAASSSHAGAGTRNSGLAAGAGAASGAGAGTSTGVNAGIGADLLIAGLGLGNTLGPEIVQLNNALNSLLGQTASGPSGEINPQILRQLLGDNRREGLLPGDAGERIKARLRVSHPHLLPDT